MVTTLQLMGFRFTQALFVLSDTTMICDSIAQFSATVDTRFRKLPGEIKIFQDIEHYVPQETFSMTNS